jgi:uncharacterized YigZ family protein
MPLSSLRSYVTIAGRSSAEIEVRRSRFICDLERVETELAAREFIDAVRAGSREARHHCTAFILGPDGATQRSNDDGEPSATAGAPMLEVLRGRGLSDVVAVVTRWFGGVLLGTGGLIRAYGDAVRVGLDAATLVPREVRTVLGVIVSHVAAPRLENALRNHPRVTVTDVAYAASDVTLTVVVAPEAGEEVRALVAELSSGTAQLADLGEEWVDVPHA